MISHHHQLSQSQDDKINTKDCLYCIVFVLSKITILLMFAFYLFDGDDFMKSTTNYDADGKSCGKQIQGYPMIYFVSPSKDEQWKGVCLKECPQQEDTSLECYPNSVVTSCSNNIEIYQTFICNFTLKQDQDTICMPTSDQIKEKISNAIDLYSFEQQKINSKFPQVLISSIVAILFFLRKEKIGKKKVGKIQETVESPGQIIYQDKNQQVPQGSSGSKDDQQVAQVSPGLNDYRKLPDVIQEPIDLDQQIFMNDKQYQTIKISKEYQEELLKFLSEQNSLEQKICLNQQELKNNLMQKHQGLEVNLDKKISIEELQKQLQKNCKKKQEQRKEQKNKAAQQMFKRVHQNIIKSNAEIIDIKKVEESNLNIKQQIEVFKTQAKDMEKKAQNLLKINQEELYQNSQQLTKNVKDFKIIVEETHNIQQKYEVKIQKGSNTNEIYIDSETINVYEMHKSIKQRFKSLNYFTFQCDMLKGGDNGTVRIKPQRGQFLKEMSLVFGRLKEIVSSINSEVAKEGIQSLKNDINVLIRQNQILAQENIDPQNETLVQKYFRQNPIIDLVIVIDTTGSMDTHLKNVKEQTKNIVRLCKQVNPKASINVAIISYKDHEFNDNGEQDIQSQVCKGTGFIEDTQQIQKQIDILEANGGEDDHEAVLDGLAYAAKKLNYRKKSTRMVFLILDAPPHGKEYHEIDASDNYPEGCPCGLKIQDIAKGFNQRSIHLLVRTPKNVKLQNMKQIFKKNFKKYSYQSSLTEEGEQFANEMSKNINTTMDELNEKRRKINIKLQKLLEQIKKDVLKQIQVFIKAEQADKMREQLLKKERQLREKFKNISDQKELQLLQYNLLMQQYYKKVQSEEETMSQTKSMKSSTTKSQQSLKSSKKQLNQDRQKMIAYKNGLNPSLTEEEKNKRVYQEFKGKVPNGTIDFVINKRQR